MRSFLGLAIHEKSPDHSSMTNTRKRLPLEVFSEVFSFVLAMADIHDLIRGKTLGVDSTMLEANAAMKTIVRKDSGDDWMEYLRKLYEEETGEQNPTDEDLRRFDRRRKNKKVSNDEWESSTDRDSRIAKMKDGRTAHLAYKAENTVDLDTEIVLAAEIYHANHSDQDTDRRVDGSGRGQPHPRRSRSYAEGKRRRQGLLQNGNAWGIGSSRGAIAHISPSRSSTAIATGKTKPRKTKRRPLITVAAKRGERGKALHRLRSELVERSFCPHLRNGRSPPLLASRAPESSKTLPDGCHGTQPRADPAQGFRPRQAPRRPRNCRACFIRPTCRALA